MQKYLSKDNKTIHDWAGEYIAEGYQVVPIKHNEKKPYDTDWTSRAFGRDDFKAEDSIGLKLGTAVGCPCQFLSVNSLPTPEVGFRIAVT